MWTHPLLHVTHLRSPMHDENKRARKSYWMGPISMLNHCTVQIRTHGVGILGAGVCECHLAFTFLIKKEAVLLKRKNKCWLFTKKKNKNKCWCVWLVAHPLVNEIPQKIFFYLLELQKNVYKHHRNSIRFKTKINNFWAFLLFSIQFFVYSFQGVEEKLVKDQNRVNELLIMLG